MKEWERLRRRKGTKHRRSNANLLFIKKERERKEKKENIYFCKRWMWNWIRAYAFFFIHACILFYVSCFCFSPANSRNKWWKWKRSGEGRKKKFIIRLSFFISYLYCKQSMDFYSLSLSLFFCDFEICVAACVQM